MTILFVSGINDRSVVGVTVNDNSQVSYLFDGNCSIQYKLPLKPGIAAHVVLFGKGVKQPEFEFEQMPSLVFNQIADADTHHGALQRCLELCGQLEAPVINRPELIMRTTREQVAARLQGIPGVTMPRTIRFSPASPGDVYAVAEQQHFGFPFIVRKAGDHGGKSTTLVRSREDFDTLHMYPFDGRDFYMTEYVDIKDSKGWYHKQRIAVIDGEPHLRHALFDSKWAVHAASREFMDTEESWPDYLQRLSDFDTRVLPRMKPAIEEITNRLKLDYYGIDCCANPEGELLVFEANANMNVLFNIQPAMTERVDRIKKSIQAMMGRRSGEVVI